MSARRHRITVYRGPGGWRWRWVAGNGRVIGASTEGYVRRADALANLQTLAGGQVYITYRHRTAAGEYAQGYLVQIDPWVETFVQVLP